MEVKKGAYALTGPWGPGRRAALLGNLSAPANFAVLRPEPGLEKSPYFSI